MQIHSTPTRAVQYLTAAIFTLIALSIILQDVIGPDILARWQLQHTLAVGLIVGTTLAIEAVVTTWTDSRRTLSVGYSVVAMIGLCLIVFMSGGRQAEAQAERDRVASAHNARIADAKKRLDDAVAAKAAADEAIRASAPEKHCASNCRNMLLSDQTKAADEVASARTAYDAMPPPMQVGSKEGAFWSDTLSPWVEKPIVEHIAPKALYLLLVGFAELGAALSWIAARPRHRGATVAREPRQSEDTAAPAPLEREAHAAAPNPLAEQSVEQPDTTALEPSDPPPTEAPAAPRQRIRKAAASKRPKGRKPKRIGRSEIISDLMLRAATGREFKSEAEAARTYGYSPSRWCELRKQWKEEGALV